MQGLPLKASTACAAIFCFLGAIAAAEETAPTTTIVVSVAEQKLAVLRDGGLLKKFPISTSKFGLGDELGSYKTPLGKLRVCEKIGDDLSAGAVFKQRQATGEVLPVNAPGRDPIVTRILWLDGLEAQNQHARGRGIYIHGTTEESRIGEPVSYGCIRMRSKDVVELFDEVPLEAEVAIIEEKLPRYAKYRAPKPQMIAAKPAPATPAPALAKKEPAVFLPATAPAAPLPETSSEPKPKPVRQTMARRALKGSIMDAGLPQGPKIPAAPAPSAPKELPPLPPDPIRSATESAFSLHGIARDLSPEIRATEMDAAARSNLQSKAESAPAKAPARIAFRTGKPDDRSEP